MTFFIITQVKHTYYNGVYYAFAPYVKEMNLWLKYVDKVIILAPISIGNKPSAIEMPYKHAAIEFIPVHGFNLTQFSDIVKSVFIVPFVFIKILKAIYNSDHIHLRCPGNMGLLGSIAQIVYPGKIKTAKYAGNWDTKSKQPWSYRIQRWILNNTFLTRRIKVLVYGKWAYNSKNVVSFFTASYPESELIPIEIKALSSPIKLIFVGTLSKGKQPMVTCLVTQQLLQLGLNASLDIFGEGPERSLLESFISTNHLEQSICLHGNQHEDILKAAYKNAHFLIFISETEGWPKVVAEAMWWGCLPITTAVSCVPEMLGYGERGDLVNSDPEEVVSKIQFYLSNEAIYQSKCKSAMEWSRKYNLEYLDASIKSLLQG